MGNGCCKPKTKNETNKKSNSTKSFRISNYSKMSDFRKKYDIISLLGNGGFGKVRLYRTMQNKTDLYAIKTLKKEGIKESSIKMISEEIEILKSLDHPNIVKYFETYEDRHYIHIVMEYIAGHDLFHVISQRKMNKFTEKDFAEIIYNLLRAVYFLHDRGLVHRDIKPENILFSKDGVYSSLKLIDFGLATKLNSSDSKRCGTPHYIAPEIIQGRFSSKTDSWSIGIVMYVMVTGKFPFGGKEVFARIASGSYDKAVLQGKRRSRELVDLIERLIIVDENERLSVGEALEHDWFKIFNTHNHEPVEDNVINALSQFNEKNCFQKEVMFFLAKFSTEDEVDRLKKAFRDLDSDKTGTLKYNEIIRGFEMLGYKLSKVIDLKIGRNG